MWWYLTVATAIVRQRQEGPEFEIRPHNIRRTCLKKERRGGERKEGEKRTRKDMKERGGTGDPRQ